MDAWGFTGDSFRVPEQAELDALLRRVSSGEIQMQAESTESVALGEGQAIDLGGIAMDILGKLHKSVFCITFDYMSDILRKTEKSITTSLTPPPAIRRTTVCCR